MLSDFAPGHGSRFGPCRHSSNPRPLYLLAAATLFMLILTFLTLSPWGPHIGESLGKTVAALGQPVTGAGVVPTTQSTSMLPLPAALLPKPSNPQAAVPPDPLELPGWLEGTKWVTSDPNVQIHHWLQQLIDGQGGSPKFDWARNATVLFLGDSVLREWLFALCDKFVDGQRNRLTFHSDQGVEEKNEGWECIVPSTGTRFINGFVFGMTNFSKYATDSPLMTNNFPPPPWLMEERIPMMKEEHIHVEPDMVVVNSGAWEMLTLYRRDLLEGGWSDNISSAELDEFGTRLRACMNLVKSLWPASKHLFVQMQPFRADDVWSRWIWAQTLARAGGHSWGIDFSGLDTSPQSMAFVAKTLPPCFTRRRVSQLASTYRRIAAEEQWDSLDFWKVAEAFEPGWFYPPTDPVHPAPSGIHVILDFLLEKLWRLKTYNV